jgi:hypothetical protein
MTAKVIYLSDRRRKVKRPRDPIESPRDAAVLLSESFTPIHGPLPDLNNANLPEWIFRLERGVISLEEGLELFEFLVSTAKIQGMDPSYKYVAETLIKMNMIYAAGLSENVQAIEENRKERNRRIDAAMLIHSMVLY